MHCWEKQQTVSDLSSTSTDELDRATMIRQDKSLSRLFNYLHWDSHQLLSKTAPTNNKHIYNCNAPEIYI